MVYLELLVPKETVELLDEMDKRAKVEETVSQEGPDQTAVRERTDEMVLREVQDEMEAKETEEHQGFPDSLEIEELLVLLEKRDEQSTAKMEIREAAEDQAPLDCREQREIVENQEWEEPQEHLD